MTPTSDASQLDLPQAPSRLRLLLPTWLRSLIWTDEIKAYDAFLSYSWKADRQTAIAIQSTLQNFICPWYRVRALNVFRDLSSLPANSNLENALFDRLDKSKTLIVLASPEARESSGMELEAKYWFSRPRSGDVIVVLTSGSYSNWAELRDSALPPTLRSRLQPPPLWIDLSRRPDIFNRAKDSMLRNQLIDDLRQLILVFYPGLPWESLRGEERVQHQRAVGIVLIVSLILVAMLVIAGQQRRQAVLERAVATAALKDKQNAISQETAAKREAAQKTHIADLETRLEKEEEAKRKQAQNTADAQEMATAADSLRRSRPSALNAASWQAVESVVKDPSLVTEEVLRSSLSILPPLIADIDVPCRPLVAEIDPKHRFLALGDTGDICLVDLMKHKLILHDKFPDSLENVTALRFGAGGSLIAASNSFSIEAAAVIREFSGPQWKEITVGRLNVRISSIALSARDSWIAIGTEKGEVAVERWDEHNMLKTPRWITITGTQEKISVLKFDQSGERLLVGSRGALEVWSNRDRNAFERLWSQPFGEDSLPFLSEPPVAIDQAWNLLAIAHDGVVEILNAKNFERIQTIQISDVDGLVFTAQGWLTAHTKDGNFRAWFKPKTVFVPADRASFDLPYLTGELTSGRQLATSVDGEYLVAVHTQQGSTESWGSLLQITSAEETARFYHSDRIWYFFSLGAGSSGVTAAEYKVRVWGNILERRGQTSHLHRNVAVFAVNGSNSLAAIASRDDFLSRTNHLQLWDLRRATVSSEYYVRYAVKALRIRDGSQPAVDIATDDALWRWSPLDGNRAPEKALSFPPLSDSCKRQVALARHSDAMAIAAGRGEIWGGTGRSLRRLLPSAELPNACAEALAISPNGKEIAASFLLPQPMVLVFDAATARMLVKIKTEYLVRSMTFDAEGRRLGLATALKPKTPHDVGNSGVELWSSTTGKRLVNQNLNMVGGIFHPICLSRDGAMLGTTQGSQAQIYHHNSSANHLELQATQPLRTVGPRKPKRPL